MGVIPRHRFTFPTPARIEVREANSGEEQLIGVHVRFWVSLMTVSEVTEVTLKRSHQMVSVAPSRETRGVFRLPNLNAIFINCAFNWEGVPGCGHIAAPAPNFMTRCPMEAGGCKICAKYPPTVRYHPIAHCATPDPTLPGTAFVEIPRDSWSKEDK